MSIAGDRLDGRVKDVLADRGSDGIFLQGNQQRTERRRLNPGIFFGAPLSPTAIYSVGETALTVPRKDGANPSGRGASSIAPCIRAIELRRL